jgi:nicotinamidase-related amidase
MAMTMLQMAGAAPTPATTADGILLIIDAQREYTDGLLPLLGVDEAIGALATLLEKARKAGTPVVHVRHQSKPQESDRRWFHDPHVRLGDSAGGHRSGFHEHDRG